MIPVPGSPSDVGGSIIYCIYTGADINSRLSSFFSNEDSRHFRDLRHFVSLGCYATCHCAYIIASKDVLTSTYPRFSRGILIDFFVGSR